MVSVSVSSVSPEWGAFIQWPIESGRRKVTVLVSSQVSSSDNVNLFSHSQGNRRPPVPRWSWWMFRSTADTRVITLFWVRKSVTTGSHNTFNLENYLSNPEHRLCFGVYYQKAKPKVNGFLHHFPRQPVFLEHVAQSSRLETSDSLSLCGGDSLWFKNLPC